MLPSAPPVRCPAAHAAEKRWEKAGAQSVCSISQVSREAAASKPGAHLEQGVEQMAHLTPAHRATLWRRRQVLLPAAFIGMSSGFPF